MKQLAIAAVLGVVVAIATSCGGSDEDNSAAEQAALVEQAPYFHSGSAATLGDVVQTYNTRRALGLTPQQVADVAEYLKSL